MDEFSAMKKGLTSPATRHFAIFPNDNADLPIIPRVIYCQSAGDIVVRDETGVDLTYSITGAVAQTQRWQLSPQGGIWTDIPGATAVSETIDLMGGQYTDGAFIRVGVTANGQERFSSSVQLR